MGRTRYGRPNTLTLAVAAIAVGALLALSGCGGFGQTASENGVTTGTSAAPVPAQRSGLVAPEASKDAAAQSYAGAGPDASAVPTADKLIVRNKTVRLEVEDVAAAIGKVRSLAGRDGADITQLQVATSTDQPIYRPMLEGEAPTDQSGGPLQAFVTVRVPAAKYQAFIDDAAKLGRVLFQAESTDDVTQQHVDLTARLVNLRAAEARLREFFAQAKNVTEMLQVEQELTRVRGDIESLAAQVAYLERQAAMATVTIEMAEPKPIIRPAGTDWGFNAALTTGIRAFVSTINGMIVIVLAIAPLLLLVIVAGFIIRAVWRRNARRHADRTAAQSAEQDRSADRV